MKKNSWWKRYHKFVWAALGAMVEAVNATTGGPHWVYVVTGILSAIAVAVARNAPLFKEDDQTTG